MCEGSPQAEKRVRLAWFRLTAERSKGTQFRYNDAVRQHLEVLVEHARRQTDQKSIESPMSKESFLQGSDLAGAGNITGVVEVDRPTEDRGPAYAGPQKAEDIDKNPDAKDWVTFDTEGRGGNDCTSTRNHTCSVHLSAR